VLIGWPGAPPSNSPPNRSLLPPWRGVAERNGCLEDLIELRLVTCRPGRVAVGPRLRNRQLTRT
jgi:hypothetical protein